MRNENTYFEQVPLDAIKKIIEEDRRRHLKIEKPADRKTAAIDQGLLPPATTERPGGRS